MLASLGSAKSLESQAPLNFKPVPMIQIEKRNAPKLRFPEFEEPWQKHKLGELGSFKSGVGFPESEQGGTTGIPFYKVSDMNLPGNEVVMTTANNFVTKEQVAKLKLKPTKARAVIFAKVGAAIFLERKRKAKNFLLDNNMMAFIPGDEIRDEYLSHLFSVLRLSKFAQVGALPSYNSSDLATIKLSLPSVSEQSKIASFLDSVDVKIAQLKRNKSLLENYKNGCMQKIFSQKIRFKDENGNNFPDWEEKKLGEVATRIRQKNDALDITDVLTNSAVQGIISQGDYFEHDVANAENLDRYTIVQTGDFVYNPRISATAPVGPIKRNKLRVGVMSPLYDVFRFNKNENPDFWEQYFNANQWHKYMKQVANYGARHDRMAISSGDFIAMPLPYPHPKEQHKIAEFLFILDRKIELLGKELTYAFAFKQGLLQQMFV